MKQIVDSAAEREGTVLMEPVGGWVVHDPTPRCPTCEPHYMDSCGEFDAPRTAPPVEKKDRERRWIRWDRAFPALDGGASIFTILDDPRMSYPFAASAPSSEGT